VKINWSTEDWARKLKEQAAETKEYRYKLYKKVALKNKKHVLDVGCGTGIITKDLVELTKGKVVGIDIDTKKLKIAKKILDDETNVKIMEVNALDLPFGDETFDLVVFNIVMIHINKKDQQKALNEMVRVTQKDGIVLATLEPDYQGIIDYPKDPAKPIFTRSLKDLGADQTTGRKLKTLFTKAGLKTVVGIDTKADFILSKNDEIRLKRFENNFWMIKRILKKNGWSANKIEQYRQKQTELIKSGLSFRFSPCYYAIGRKV